MANTRDMIDALHRGDNLEAEKAFNDAIKNNMTNTEAFYKAMITLKALKG